MSTFADLKAQCDYLAQHFSHSPSNDNVNMIWAELLPGGEGWAYCGAGVSWEWKHAGRPYQPIDQSFGFTYCPDAVHWAKNNGMWDESGHYAPGDTIFYCWDGSGVAEHTGTVISDDGVNIHTFECNTSPGTSGNQSDGEGCYYRVRPHGSMVLGVLKSSRWLNGTPTPGPVPQPTQLGQLPLAVDGVPGLQTYAALQRAVGAGVDGVPGPDTWKHVQARVGVAQDGDPGPITWKAVQRHVGDPHLDGQPGPETWTYVQKSLNARKF